MLQFYTIQICTYVFLDYVFSCVHGKVIEQQLQYVNLFLPRKKMSSVTTTSPTHAVGALSHWGVGELSSERAQVTMAMAGAGSS